MSKVLRGALRHALPVSLGDDRARGSSRPFDAAELAAIAAFRDVKRIAQGEFSDVSRAELLMFSPGGVTKAARLRRRREAGVVA